MEEELQSRDVSLMLLSLELKDRYDPTLAFEWVQEHRVDGLIIAKCHRQDAGRCRPRGGHADRRRCTDQVLMNVPVEYTPTTWRQAERWLTTS